MSSPYNLPQETQNSLKTKEKRLKSNRKVNGDVQKKNKNKKILEMGGLGALLAYLGGWVCGNVLDVYPNKPN